MVVTNILKSIFFVVAGAIAALILTISYLTFIHAPSIQTYSGKDASAIDVYVLDSGVNHIEANSEDIRLTTSLDFTLDAIGDNSLIDCLGHGTTVSNILVREASSLGSNINLHSLKVFGCSESVAEDGLAIHTALQWVLENHDPSRRGVVNMSLNFGGVNITPANYVIDRLNERGIIVVTSAGNNQADACDFAPASLDSTIAVGNLWIKPSTGVASLAANSNYGDCVDIYSSGRFMCQPEPKIRHSCSGTSFAAPVISARVVELLYSDYDLTIEDARKSLLADAVELNDNYLFLRPSEETISGAVAFSSFND
jgi:serine protease